MRVGMEVPRGNDFSGTLTQENSSRNMDIIPTSPKLRAGRKGAQSMDGTKMRRCKLGEVCLVATVSRSNRRARSAGFAFCVSPFCGNDAYRINELARAATEWHYATALQYVSSSHPVEKSRV